MMVKTCNQDNRNCSISH